MSCVVSALLLVLVISGCGGSKVGLGNLDSPPRASFTATPNGPTGFDFDASASSDPDGGAIVSYAWDFDYDGLTFNVMTSGPSPLADYTYPGPGTYTVMLRVTDDEGDVAFSSLVVKVFPAASVTVNDNLICIGNDDTSDDVVTFDASASDPGPGYNITQFEWDVTNDGVFETNTGLVPAHSYGYLSAGNYTCALRITTDAPAVGTDTVAVKVVELTAAFTAPPNGAPDVPVTFDASSSVV